MLIRPLFVWVLPGLFLTKLCQNAACRFRMQESDVQTVGTLAGSLVDEADALFVTHGQSLAYSVLNLESYVVDATAAVVEEFLNGTFGARGFQQLQFHFTHFQESGFYFLVFYDLCLVHFQTQYVLKVGQHGINALYGNAQMFDFGNFHSFSL